MLFTRRATVIAALALVTSCAETVRPGDPLVGTWRSDEYTTNYPAPPTIARTVDESTFAADGTMALVTTRRFAIVDGDPYSGCHIPGPVPFGAQAFTRVR